MSAILKKAIEFLLSKTDGYKTYFSGIGMIGYAIYLVFAAQPPNIEKAFEFFIAGLGVLGLGHKVAKNTAAQNVVDGPVTPATLTKQIAPGVYETPIQ